MPSSRSVIAKPKPPKLYKRPGNITEPERQLVAQLVHEHPRELSPAQVNGLAKAMRRSPAIVKELVEQAKEEFVSQADHYVRVHRKVVDDALANGDPKSLSVALEGSQWFLEKVSEQGARVIEKEAKAEVGQRVMIGIRIGAVDQPVDVVTIPTITVEPQ